MNRSQVHFDCTKNTLPPNWTNSNATAYYNRKFWKRCKCEYGPDNPCKHTADRFNPVATEPTQWTEGCCHNCHGNIGGTATCNCRPNNCRNCHGDNDDNKSNISDHSSISNRVDNAQRDIKIDQRLQPYVQSRSLSRSLSQSRSCGGCGGCGECQDVSIVYRMPNPETDCDNIVELKIPVGGSKEMYLAKFSPAFLYANRFQCATLPAPNLMHNNLIDNRRQEEFTVSDQSALTKRGINNALYAQHLVDTGQLTHTKQAFTIPMNVIGRSSYYYLGDIGDGNVVSGAITGLSSYDLFKGYFKNN